MKKDRLIVLDIGNTDTVCGIFRGKKISREFRIPTKQLVSGSRVRQWLRKHLGNRKKIRGMILCSVVPRKNRLFRQAAEGLGLPLYIVGKTVRCPIPNRYRLPRQVGQDRLVNAYAALKQYGAPVIVVDFGTAITVDLVSKKGEYLGGVIAPGMGISLEALKEKTALLPRVKLRPPRTLLGRDTKGSMLSGAFYGFASLCDGLVVNLRKKYGGGIQAVATGGHSNFISSYCKKINYVNPHLTLQGLRLIFEAIRK